MRQSSPSSVFAPAPAAVSTLASAVSGFRFAFVRPSPRSFSRWVCVCLFSSASLADGFASAVASGLSLPFCRVRRAFGGWGVSVPVFVRLLRRPRCSVFRVLPVRAPLAASLPAFVRSALVCACAVGFSGSRSSVPSAVSLAAAAVAPPFGPPIFVGCAAGVDAAFRALLPGASVLRAASFGSGRGAFAARSVAVVLAVVSAAGSRGLWVSFPSAACPAGLLPSASSSRCFCGSGSGSWASLAFAVGSGLPCLVFGFPPPAAWGFAPVGGGWFFRGAPVQLSLF
ncbi:hypothetical protein QUB56_31875 [Microcoleus sp. AR_TQ3_B6]|uniref:hypothetical protein n=1 Tax=Microcoleus sp. AR_TQ3_B6 TaxID=3055284 RepID=UPI002FD06508